MESIIKAIVEAAVLLIPPLAFIGLAALALHVMSTDFKEFVQLLGAEIRSFVSARPTLKSLNFVGILIAAGLVLILQREKLIHVVPSKPDHADSTFEMFKMGMNFGYAALFLVALLLCVKLCKSERN